MRVIAIFAKCAIKNEEILRKFADLYLKNNLRNLIKFEMWPPWVEAKFGAIWIRHYGATDA